MANFTLDYTGAEVNGLLNKIDTAFGEETVMGDTFTWDGSIIGKEYSSALKLCRVSDVVLTTEDVVSGKISTSIIGEFTIGSEVVYMDVSSQFGIEAYGFIMASSGAVIAAVVPNDCEITGVGQVRKGLYFGIDTTSGFFVTSLTLNNYQFEKNVVAPIESKFLPVSGIKFVDMISAGNNNYTMTKTFEEISNMIDEGDFIVARVPNTSNSKNFACAFLTNRTGAEITFLTYATHTMVAYTLSSDNIISATQITKS